ncbi:MAG: alpha-amylase family glycosyl hydrolase [Eubacteriales bacterium]|nr:alpha-amylase family glycosyl hydrolase [Eubacteriales bacterium]
MIKDPDLRLLDWSEEQAKLLPELPSLGIKYSSEETRFRLYAPTAEAVSVLLYPLPENIPAHSQESYLAAVRESSDYQAFLAEPNCHNYHHLLMLLTDYSSLSRTITQAQRQPLKKLDNGLWELVLEGEFFGWRYNYELRYESGRLVRSQDPYAKILSTNGRYGVIADVLSLDILPSLKLEERGQDSLNQGSAASSKLPLDYNQSLEAIIYEGHIRDFSIRPNINFEFPGTYLAWTERGLKNSAGQAVGLDHLLKLGITHLEFLPIYNIATLDEEAPRGFNEQYNWGYDPAHYFAVEGLYSTKPADPFRRILELKFLCWSLRRAGIKVIMDVVFNHVYDYHSHPLELCSPGSCFRLNGDGEPHNGSFCGSETKSESPYFRRYMLDCLSYWAENFKLGGFRFDLMGLHDVPSMQMVREKLDQIDPEIIILGEGWIMGNHPADVQPSNEQNACLLPGIAFFNDSFRELMRGNAQQIDYNSLLSGQAPSDVVWNMYNSLMGGRFVKDFGSPNQNVLYLECHDNHSLYDLLKLKLKDLSESELAERLALGFFVQSLGHGLLFIHAGQDFARTKHGIDNSYNSPDEINAIDWERLAEFKELSEKFKELIEYRKQRAILKLSDPWLLGEKNKLIVADHNRLIYSAKFAQKELCLINFRPESWPLVLPPAYRLSISSLLSGEIKAVESKDSTAVELPPFCGAVFTALD